MKPVALGVIGCGVIGRHHLAAASQSPMIRVAAVADLIEEKGREMVEQYGIPKRYVDGIDLLEDPEIEAVVLAFPAVGRFPLAMKAFGKGIHVLTEKPVAMNAGEVRQMIAARGDLVAGCCSSRYRFLPSADCGDAIHRHRRARRAARDPGAQHLRGRRTSGVASAHLAAAQRRRTAAAS